MTRSPDFSVSTNILGCLASIFSATMGDMLHLKKPTPMPKKMRPITNAARAPFGLTMTWGMADMMMMTWPSVAMPIATLIVLYRPQ